LTAAASSLSPRERLSLRNACLTYQVTGGYLTAINELAMEGEVSSATRRIYSDWIRGDVLRQGKNETYLLEVIQAIIRRYGSQVTWSAMARDLSIEHHQTVSDYCLLLERMDAAMIIPALSEHRLAAAPKKARKIYFADPFILHSMRESLGDQESVPVSLESLCKKAELLPGLMEAAVLSLARRRADTFYIKGAAGEVDCAYLEDGGFWPIEVNWSAQPRPRDLKQLRRYDRGIIAADVCEAHEIDGCPVLPLPVVLLRLSRL